MQRVVSIIVLLLLAAPAFAEERKSQITTWFKQLADREPAMRIEARQALMGMQSSELPLLREIVAASVPLHPAQIDPLQDIVSYIRVRESIRKLPQTPAGFLGVSLPMVAMEQFDDDDENSTPAGVPVLNRLRGFVAYRSLEDGDVILAIGGAGQQVRPTTTPQQLKAVVSTLRSGDTVAVRVQRGALVLTIQFSLDGAPLLTDEERSTQQIVNDAEYEADQYFDLHFRSFVGPQEV